MDLNIKDSNCMGYIIDDNITDDDATDEHAEAEHSTDII